MKKILIVLSLIFIICGCSEKNVYKIMEENEHIIVDVRTEEEYKKSHIEDAINIPYNEIDEDIDLDKDKIIFVYCKSGKRSEIAYNNLIDLGYTVYDLGAFSTIDLPKE